MRLPLRFFLRLPLLLFKLAGLVGVINCGKRRFRKVLIESSLPEDIVERLVEEFDPSTPLRETLFRFSRR
ncbi:hypothetical protein E3E26_07945 [Thermococcus sp. LS1]|nr:hypothetical protein [Thermococcus sp. LS1]